MNNDDPTTSDNEVVRGETALMYALMIRDERGHTDYLMASRELPSGTIDGSTGLELPGGNYYSDGTALYYHNFEANALQRFVVDRKLEIKRTGQINLAKYIGCTPVFISADKALCIAPDDGLLIEFDPTAMKITREIATPALHRRNMPGYIRATQRIGERCLASVVYLNEDATALSADSTIAVALDDGGDQPLTLLRDARAVSADSSFTDAEGNFYTLADGFSGYWSLVQQQPIAPRVLRVKRDAGEVDPDYLLDVGELLATPAVNGLWPLTGTKFVLQAWRGGPPGEGVLTAENLELKPNWEWHIVDAETRETTPIAALGRAPTSNSLLRFVVDEQLYLQQYVVPNEDIRGLRTELYKVYEDGNVEKAFDTSSGDMRAIVRVKVVN